jgi:hypothetical protein
MAAFLGMTRPADAPEQAKRGMVTQRILAYRRNRVRRTARRIANWAVPVAARRNP